LNINAHESPEMTQRYDYHYDVLSPTSHVLAVGHGRTNERSFVSAHICTGSVNAGKLCRCDSAYRVQIGRHFYIFTK